MINSVYMPSPLLSSLQVRSILSDTRQSIDFSAFENLSILQELSSSTWGTVTEETCWRSGFSYKTAGHHDPDGDPSALFVEDQFSDLTCLVEVAQGVVSLVKLLLQCGIRFEIYFLSPFNLHFMIDWLVKKLLSDIIHGSHSFEGVWFYDIHQQIISKGKGLCLGVPAVQSSHSPPKWLSAPMLNLLSG